MAFNFQPIHTSIMHVLCIGLGLLPYLQAVVEYQSRVVRHSLLAELSFSTCSKFIRLQHRTWKPRMSCATMRMAATICWGAPSTCMCGLVWCGAPWGGREQSTTLGNNVQSKTCAG
jgi:hypothetical protein